MEISSYILKKNYIKTEKRRIIFDKNLQRPIKTALVKNQQILNCFIWKNKSKPTGYFMKFSNYLVAFGLLFLGFISINANAQTPVCTWNSVYGYTNNNISYTIYICRLSSNVVVATRTDTWSYGRGHSCGTPNVSDGYHNTQIRQGSTYLSYCNDTIVATNTSTSSSSSNASNPIPTATICYTGEFQIIQTSPGVYTPFNPAFCGPQPQCGHTATVLDPHSYPRIKYTCL